MTTYINPKAIENKSITKDKLSDDLIFDIKGEIPKNEIWYTSSDGEIVEPNDTYVFGANIVSNTYDNDRGVIKFDSDVTSIEAGEFDGDGCFYDCTSLTSVTIPDSVTSIGNSAFNGCSSLTSVTIGNSVTSIGNYAFENCTSLSTITIPNSVTLIGDGAFFGCDSLTSVTIPDSVTSIGNETFSGCTSLTSVTIPDSVTSIGFYAFNECTSLTSITIPDSVTMIVYGAFNYCTSLTGITIPNSVTSIESSAFEGCESLTSIIIPDSVVGSIGTYTFNCCYSLKNVTIGKGITSIESNAFESCDVTNLSIRSENVPYMDGDVFYDANVSKIYVPINSLDSYKSATNWSEYADIMVGVVFEDENLISGQNIKTINGGVILGSGDIDLSAPEVLYIQRNDDQLVVTASDERLLDYVSVTQGSYGYAKLDLSKAGISVIEKPAISSIVYCANRADGTTGGTNLTSAVSNVLAISIKEQELKMQFENYEKISNIQYAKFKIVDAHCIESPALSNRYEYESSWCYLQANTDIMSGYSGTPNRLETIIVKVGDYVYIDKNFIRGRSELEEESTRNYCGWIDHYYLYGGGDKSNGHLYVKVKGESGDYMMGVNILCGANYSWGNSTEDFGSDMDIELIEKELGCIYYCVKGFSGDPDNPSIPFVIKLDRQFDIIVNDIDSRIIEDQFDIDIMIPFEAKCYKPIKFIDKYVYVPEGSHYMFNFKPLFYNTGGMMQQMIYFKPYKKTERGYIADVRDGEFFAPNIFTINSMSDEDIDFKIIEFNPIKINGSTTWCVITNASL